MEQQTPYQLLGGDDGVRRLAEAFYDAMDELAEAATIRAMHAENLDVIKEKLFEYFSGWMGGPPVYAEKYGSVCLTSPHDPYAIGFKERDQWLLCFNKALETIGAGEELKQMLETPMYRVADAVRNCEDSTQTKRGKDGVIAVG
jgi:hemoglobin